MTPSAAFRLVPHTLALALGAALAAPALATPWLWDADGNRIDDRIERIESSGLVWAFENQDPVNGRLILAVEALASGVRRYGVYVGFDHHPTDADLDALRASGVDTTILHRYHSIDYVRMALTFEEIGRVAQLPGVRQVEAIPMMYPLNNNAIKSGGVGFSNYQRFPTVHEHLGITGKDVVVAILDTGVNDAPDPLTGYPGHESLIGRFVAGGNFFAGNPALNTGIDDSVNPVDRGEMVASTHGTHVAGTAIGTGGPSRVFGGVAPDALLVDLKVLSDAGAGFGSADGVDWAIANRDRYNIRVLNLSLGGVSASDGRDASSQAINRAYAAGLVAAVAAGNDGNTGYMPSPAAADFALTVGSMADQNTIDRDDDQVSSFSNEGPRMSDGDADFVDEMKPEVGAAGSGIVSADGSLLTDGRQYKSLSGTSMAAPHVAGVVALLLEAKPDLTPAEVIEILKHTADHRDDWGKTPAGARPFPDGDPNYHPSAGWGQVDAYAAVKEALRMAGDPASQTQVVRISGEADADAAAITLRWTSQRETALSGYNVWRAEDVNGVPGVFGKLNAALIPGTGQAQIEGLSNRNHYAFEDAAALQPGRIYWYQVEQVSAAGSFREPALPVALGQVRPVATLRYSITHNAIDNDLLVLLGSGPDAARANFVIDGASAQQAVAVTTEPGEATTGNARHEFELHLTSLDGVEHLLPPSDRQPWFLSVKEGGYLNRSGRLNRFEIVTYDADGEISGQYATADLTPQPTIEGQTSELWIPDDPQLTLPGESPTVISLAPNAGAAGSTVQVELTGGDFLPLAGVAAGAGVTIDNVQVHGGTSISARFTIAADAVAGPRDVTVTNLDGASDTLVAGFTVSGENDGGGEPVAIEIGDDDEALEYRTGWHRKEDAAASGGSYHRRAGNGGGADSWVRLVFEGDQVSYFYARSEGGGSADLYLNDELVQSVSYAGSAPRNAPEFGAVLTFDTPGDGPHELRIVHRGGLAYVDGFRIVAGGGEAATDASAAQSRSSTDVLRSSAALITHPVAVSALDESLSVEVDGAGGPITVELLGPAGNLVGTAQALLGLGGLYALDAMPSVPGTYTVRVVQPALQRRTLEVSTARTVHVR